MTLLERAIAIASVSEFEAPCACPKIRSEQKQILTHDSKKAKGNFDERGLKESLPLGFPIPIFLRLSATVLLQFIYFLFFL